MVLTHGDVDDVGDNTHASGVTLSRSYALTGWRSPLIDAAIPLSTARRDLHGRKRGSTPELGADEYRRRQ